MRVILLDPDEARGILDDLRHAVERGMSVRVAEDEGAFKVKVGHGSWSPPLGVVEVDD
jgi:hypothetical protein